MSNIYHSDIYQFNKPVPSYWEATSSENLNLNKLSNIKFEKKIDFEELYLNSFNGKL